MAPSSNPIASVIFMTPRGPRTLDFIALDAGDMIRAARQMGATHWVCQDGYDREKQMPIWALFETRRAGTEGPRGEPSLPVPTKTWTLPNIDFLFMWAMHMHAARKE